MLEIDVFLICGQSNSVGKGDSSTSPKVSSAFALQYYNGNITTANDPVGAANTGSMWPSFAITYHSATDKKICFVPSAVNGSPVQHSLDIGTSSWDNSGTLTATAINNANLAMAQLRNEGYEPRFKGVLWHQGETDALGPTGYQAGLIDCIAKFRASFGSTMPFYIFRVGTNSGGDTGFVDVRLAQEAIAVSDPYTFIVYRDTVNFAQRSLLTDTVHYTQAAYNEMGRAGASAIVSGTSPIEVIQFAAIKNNVDQTGIADATQTKITFTTVGLNRGLFYDATNSKFLPKVAGRYRLTANMYYNTGTVANAEGQIFILKNGSVIRRARYSPGNTAPSTLSISDIVDANGTTDYFEIAVYLPGGGTHGIYGGNSDTWFSGELI